MRRLIIMANWKMNGDESLLAQVCDLLLPLNHQSEVVICPPFTLLAATQASGLIYGAQDVSEHPKGAFTGQISAQMLRAIGCKYVIIGHSERRALCGETNSVVAQKCVQALSAGLMPVICVGETDEQHEKGLTHRVVLEQLQAVVDQVGIQGLDTAVIAYEPIWAIGTGKSATADQAQAVHKSIRDWLSSLSESLAAKIPLLYGGSVKEDNARELFNQPDIDGGLIGGASLDPEAFAAIVQETG